MHLVARRQRDAEAVQEVAQRLELLLRRRRVDAVHAGLVQPLQFLRRGDVGQHHELLDQPVAVEPRARRDCCDTRPSSSSTTWRSGRSRSSVPRALARREQGAERGVEVPISQRQAESSRRRPARVLHLLVGQAGGAAHQAAAEAVRGLAARRRRSASRRTGSRAPRPGAGCTSRWTAPRAASARRGRGNRRCCRASQAGAVERRAGPHVMRHVGDRDDQAEAASPSGSAKTASSKSRASSPSIVTSGISRRSVAPCRAAPPRARSASASAPAREHVRDVVRVDADQADGAGVAHAAQPLDHAGRLEPEPVHAAAARRARSRPASAPPSSPGGTTIPPWSAGRSARCGRPAGRGRNTPSTRPGASVQPLERAALVAAGPDRLAAGRARARPGASAGRPRGSGAIRISGGGPSPSQPTGRAMRVAIRVGAGDLHDRRLGQPSGARGRGGCPRVPWRPRPSIRAACRAGRLSAPGRAGKRGRSPACRRGRALADEPADLVAGREGARRLHSLGSACITRRPALSGGISLDRRAGPANPVERGRRQAALVRRLTTAEMRCRRSSDRAC